MFSSRAGPDVKRAVTAWHDNRFSSKLRLVLITLAFPKNFGLSSKLWFVLITLACSQNFGLSSKLRLVLITLVCPQNFGLSSKLSPAVFNNPQLTICQRPAFHSLRPASNCEFSMYYCPPLPGQKQPNWVSGKRSLAVTASKLSLLEKESSGQPVLHLFPPNNPTNPS